MPKRLFHNDLQNSIGDRQAAEGALERNFLLCKFKHLYPMKESFLVTRTVGHTFQRTAILKLPKLVACPFHANTTPSPRGQGKEVKGEK
jgi:hypothetical protein